MARAQTLLKIVVLVIVALIVFDASSHAEPTWRTFTAIHEMRKMVGINDTLYVATSGGLVITPSPDQEPRVLTNVDGLVSTDLWDILKDDNGWLWVCGFGGLTRLAPNDPESFASSNQDGPDRLLCMADDGDLLWVGSESGLLLFSKTDNGGQFLDRYSISLTNPFPRVNDIVIVGDTIWLATAIGIARAITTSPSQLKSPANWILFDQFSNPELVALAQSRIVSFRDNIYAGNPYGIFHLLIDTLSPDTTFVLDSLAINRQVFEMKVENDTLFCYSEGNFRFITSTGAYGAPPSNGLTSAPRDGINNGQFRWVGIWKDGYYHDRTGAFEPYAVEGMPDNAVSDVAVAGRGRITALFSSIKSVGQLEVDGWHVEPLPPTDVYQATTLASVDSSGNYWLGTFGNGLFRLTADSLANFDQLNSTLIGNSDGVHYVVINGLALDNRFVFAACYRAVNGKPVAIAPIASADNPSAWMALGLSDGITDIFASALDVHGEYLAYGTEGNGVYLYYFGSDPFDKSDDTVRHFTETDLSQLISNSITALRFSPAGELWAGTAFGLARYDDGTERWIDAGLPPGIGPEVIDIDFDSRGTMWVAARGGLARYDPATGEVAPFTTQNSGLVSSEINNLTVDRLSGDLYLSTNRGISLYSSGFADPTVDVSTIVAFPNPFIVNDASVGLRFNFAGAGIARIFTVAGERVIDIPVNGVWDGRNGSGEPVASGVYLFTVTDGAGRIGHGKFLLIR
jgi:hypothetical protein